MDEYIVDYLESLSEVDDEIYFELQRLEFNQYIKESINKIINIEEL